MGELLDLVESVLIHVEPGEDLEAYAVHRTETTVQAGTGPVVRHVGRSETRGVGVRVVVGARMGYASTSDLSPSGLASVVARARDNARVVDRDESAVLPRAERVAEVPGLWHAGLGATSLASKVESTIELARRVTGIDPRVRALDTAEYHDEDVLVAIASSAGVRAEHRRAFAELYTDAIAEAEVGSRHRLQLLVRTRSRHDRRGGTGRVGGRADLPAPGAADERTAGRAHRGGPRSRRRPAGGYRPRLHGWCPVDGTQRFRRPARDPRGGGHGHAGRRRDSPLAPQAAPFDDEGVGRRQTELVSAGSW